ncbi:MAG: hypothetical protein C6W55_09650 [Thermobacillus sp.]|uniref:hypothetical protein n=1 Tax=Thermobacillus sp. TaxID=2108467 RepID=UPI000E38F65C|nr:hypothetical protein [Thermobacillus sp.]REK55516.1 MAG: hypothetical protein C6W55_09650 [Thermobacillus sp.]
MADKVKLPRHICEALDKAKQDHPDIDFLAWLIPQWEEEGGYKKVIYDFSASPRDNSFIKLIDALRYGYEIEAEPITVTITPEQQEQLRQAYDRYRSALDEFSGEYLRGIRDALTLAGISIPGIPPNG